jgi:hypothetical protein
MSSFWNIVSACTSFAALSLSVYFFRRSRIAENRPILIFSNLEFVPGKKSTWAIENVGKGPAINILVGGKNSDWQWDDAEWTLYPALAVGRPERLDEHKSAFAFVAYYEDAMGHGYQTYCQDHTNTIKEGVLRPSNVRPRRSLWSLRMEAGKANLPK